jgi:hypothetical protein
MRTKKNSGFALFAVIVLLALITAAVALSLDEAVASIQAAGRARVAETIKAGLDQGLDRAIEWLQAQDAADVAPDPLAPLGQPNDIFAGGAELDVDNGGGPGMDYPKTGDFIDAFHVRVGMRAGQRTRAPEGEDVTKAYGQIVEIQLSIDTRGPNGRSLPPAEERVSVGVLVPRASAHAQ